MAEIRIVRGHRRPSTGRAVALAALLAAALAGCAAGSGTTATRTVTEVRTVTVSPPASSSSIPTSSSGTPVTAPTYGGQAPHAEPCSLLTVAEVEAATGLRVTGINGQKNPLNHSTGCSWMLTPVATCACANVGVTLGRGWQHALPSFEQRWQLDIRQHRARALPGIAHGELGTGRTGEFGSATFLSGTVIVGVGDRMGYVWTPADTAVLLKLIPLIASRAPKS